MIQIIKPASRVFAAAALFGALAFVQPTLAQTATTAAPATSTVTPAHHQRGGVEGHLTSLHKRLMITPAQEPQWADYAKVVRDNAASFEALAKERNAGIDGMNAVDDMRSYAKLTAAHAEEVQKLVPAFEALYNSMSDAQKKNADQIFAKAEQRHMTHHAKKG